MTVKLPDQSSLLPEQCKIIACDIVFKRILPCIPPGMNFETLEYQLHNSPSTLRTSLQAAIDKTSSDIKTIIIGYGLCSQGVVGLRARGFYLVIPKIDDCIALFLGSQKEYQQQLAKIPGTYYLTKEWIDTGGTPFHEVEELAKQYGETRATQIIAKLLKNYTRLACIAIGGPDSEEYRKYSRQMAHRFHLKYEQISGSPVLIQKLLNGPWDNDFIITHPGGKVSFVDFKV